MSSTATDSAASDSQVDGESYSHIILTIAVEYEHRTEGRSLPLFPLS